MSAVVILWNDWIRDNISPAQRVRRLAARLCQHDNVVPFSPTAVKLDSTRSNEEVDYGCTKD